jgi:glyoxylase-like metal-dependent hydrolase (beta-lactamase superfamily II)
VASSPSLTPGIHHVHELVEFGHGQTIDVPGNPQVIATPGHTDGSSCLELADRKVLFTGDALVTLNIVTGDRSPRIMPGSFNKDSKTSLNSLNELKGSTAELILPGHGEPLAGRVSDAVAAAQKTGPC